MIVLLCTFYSSSALREIRNRKLYKATHSTFEGYCLERWGFTRSTAYRNIRAAFVARVLQNSGQEAPPSQAQALGTPTKKSKLAKPMPPPVELLRDEFAAAYEARRSKAGQECWTHT
jgi:hypothetical protein